MASSVKPLPTFAELLDRAVQSDKERLHYLILAEMAPLAAGIMIGCLIAGQQMACRVAEDDAPEGQ